MRVNWFSPLPPAPTGSADYTARVLPFLAQRAEVVLWTHGADWDQGLERWARVRSYQIGELPLSSLRSGNLNVYHLANDAPFHAAIWEVSRRAPGIV